MNWTTQSKVIIANIVSILALALGLFGIEVEPDVQAQIVAGIGAVAMVVTSVLVAFRSREQLQADEVDAALKRQKGFARPEFLALMALLGAILLVPGCMQPQTQPQAIGQAYVAIETIADATAIAYRDGYITDTQRQEIREQLQAALQLTVDAELLGDSESRLVQAHRILLSIQRLLEQEGYRHEYE